MSPSQGRVPVRVIFGVATALGFFSAFAAFSFISTFTDKPAAFGLLLTLNLGIGLSNTRSRLDHLYGSLHRFEFRQPAEGGLLVCIAIPIAALAVEVGEDRAHPHPPLAHRQHRPHQMSRGYREKLQERLGKGFGT